MCMIPEEVKSLCKAVITQIETYERALKKQKSYKKMPYDELVQLGITIEALNARLDGVLLTTGLSDEFVVFDADALTHSFSEESTDA